MPSIQDLEKFRSTFRSIGGEASSASGTGEFPGDLPLPEEGMDENLASILETGDSEPVETEGGSAFGEPDQPEAGGDAFDFSAFLDSIPDDLGQETSGSSDFSMEPPPEATPPEEEDFGMPAGLIDGLAEEIEAETSPEAETRNPFENADFDFDIPTGFETAEESAGTDSGELVPEVLEEEAAPEQIEPFDLFTEEVPESQTPAENAYEETPAEEAAIEESADFSFGETPETPAAESAEDSEFSIPDFSFDEEKPAEVSAFEENAFEESAYEEPSAAGNGEKTTEDAFGDADFGASEFGDGFPEDEATNAPIDSFDTFSLDESFSADDFSGAGKTAEDGKPSDFATLEDFSLDGIDDIFKSSQAAQPAAKARPAGGGVPRRPAGGEDVEEINLSEDDLESLQKTLERYPLNLRIACEELIAEHAVPPDQMAALIRSLVRGSPAREMASYVSRLIGRSIVIPRGFEKSSGAELEAERNTFTYAFFHNILPVLRIFVFAAVVAASAAYLGYEFVYKPLRADFLYAQGEKSILAGDYSRGNDRFEEAGKFWRKKKWYYRYAEAFIDMRQYLLAEEKYEQLLKRYIHDKKGALDYANLETYILLNYEKADRILRHEILDYNTSDKDGLIALGDNNLAWGEYDSTRYEEARKAYAQLMEQHGRSDEYLERMLLYFIRTDNLAETLPLQEHFLKVKKARISAPALSELGGYLLDKKTAIAKGVPDPNIAKIESIKNLLLMAAKLDSAYPETYFHLARYYEYYGQQKEERAAAERALKNFEEYDKMPIRKMLFRYTIRPNQSLRWTKYRIDTHRRLANLLVREKEFIKAEETLDAGISVYEEALKKKVITRSADFGRLYADLGDLEYFKAGDVDTATMNYLNAIENGWDKPEIRYRLGFVLYSKGQWEDALANFFKAAADLPLNRRMLFALGNTLYWRGDLHAAQGYYTRLLDILEAERGRFKSLVPNERPEHADLADRLMRARNNLGVALSELAERNGDPRYKSRALALYAESAQAWDALARDPKSMVRSNSTNLAFLNTRGSLYPTSRYVSQIYTDIDRDVLEPSIWEELLEQ